MYSRSESIQLKRTRPPNVSSKWFVPSKVKCIPKESKILLGSDPRRAKSARKGKINARCRGEAVHQSANATRGSRSNVNKVNARWPVVSRKTHVIGRNDRLRRTSVIVMALPARRDDGVATLRLNRGSLLNYARCQ